jgi:mRNA interferase RelE/StbE
VLENPRRVGKPLRAPLHGKLSARPGQHRVVYEIDKGPKVVAVQVVAHRRDAYS